MSVEALREEINHSPALAYVLLRYTHMLMRQMGQITVCSLTHTVKQRFCCWLLMVHDRMERDELTFTHEYVAQLLHSRRSGISIAAGELQNEGVIRYTRGHIRLLDRNGLEAAACGCYRQVKDDYDNLLV